MASTLSGKQAVVTGASRGIGRAIALRLAHLGARVVIGYATAKDRADAVVADISASGGEAIAVAVDVSDPVQAARLIAAAQARGAIDILVNNAGIQRSALVHKMSDADWNEVLGVNLSGVFYTCRAALPAMLEKGRGHIINVASASSFMAQRGAASYAASKHGLIGLTKVLALEAARAGVLVNAVAPGLTDTDLVRGLAPEAADRLAKIVPLGRIADPDEIARMVAFVATEVTYSTGNVFHASGGVVMA
ncbi:MAG TPA: 3-oxoacyl-ACP reductase family protein [Kofleriaceae bacterium]|nr:3-oxoacyl-ACP reductase family protein [Kofleriaceae bacterium]